ncbi:hypothetical protein [Thiothrix litoralis]|nr:hypothetical protein [Thiothrix litoralis]
MFMHSQLSEAEGRWFDSSRVRHFDRDNSRKLPETQTGQAFQAS